MRGGTSEQIGKHLLPQLYTIQAGPAVNAAYGHWIPDLKIFPRELPRIFEATGQLVQDFNALSSSDSPYLLLMPHAMAMKHILEERTGQNTLPSMNELRHHPHWKEIRNHGINDTMRLTEVGNMYAAKRGDIKTTPGLSPDESIVTGMDHEYQKWQALFTEKDGITNPHLFIQSPSKAEIPYEERGTALVSHVIERIYLNWLQEYGYYGQIDDVISVLTDVMKYHAIENRGKPTWLGDQYKTVGWFDAMRAYQDKGVDKASIDELLSDYESGKIFMGRPNSSYTRIQNRNLEWLKKQDFNEMRRLGTAFVGNCLFGITKNERYTPIKGYSNRPYYTVTPLAYLDKQNKLVFTELEEQREQEATIIVDEIAHIIPLNFDEQSSAWANMTTIQPSQLLILSENAILDDHRQTHKRALDE